MYNQERAEHVHSSLYARLLSSAADGVQHGQQQQQQQQQVPFCSAAPPLNPRAAAFHRGPRLNVPYWNPWQPVSVLPTVLRGHTAQACTAAALVGYQHIATVATPDADGSVSAGDLQRVSCSACIPRVHDVTACCC